MIGWIDMGQSDAVDTVSAADRDDAVQWHPRAGQQGHHTLEVTWLVAARPEGGATEHGRRWNASRQFVVFHANQSGILKELF